MRQPGEKIIMDEKYPEFPFNGNSTNKNEYRIYNGRVLYDHMRGDNVVVGKCVETGITDFFTVSFWNNLTMVVK